MKRLCVLALICASSAWTQEVAPADCARVLGRMRKVAEPAQAGAPAVSSDTLEQGICLCKAGLWAQSAAKLRLYTAERRTSANAWYWLGEAELFQKHFDAAREAMTRALELNPKAAEGYRALGEIELELRNNDAAYHAWLRANELKPGDGRTLYYLGRLFFEADFLDEAAAWFRKALEADRTDYRSMTYLAMCAERLNFTPTATALYQRAIAESKRQSAPYAWAYLNLAKHYREGGEEGQALALLEEAEQLCPEANTLTVLGQIVASTDSARAEKLLRRAIALDSSLPDAHYRLSLLLRAAGQAAEAQREMDLFQAAKDAAERSKNMVQAIRR